MLSSCYNETKIYTNIHHLAVAGQKGVDCGKVFHSSTSDVSPPLGATLCFVFVSISSTTFFLSFPTLTPYSFFYNHTHTAIMSIKTVEFKPFQDQKPGT